MVTALLFPGQGSQTPEMRELVEVGSPELLARAIAEVGEDPFERVGDGTRFAQPALYCASITLWRRAGCPAPDLVAGHSLGEVAALVAAGSLQAEDGLRLATRRGRIMQEAAEADPDGGMLALLGDDQTARRIASEHELTVANDNAPGQVVLSGPGPVLRDATSAAKRRGLKAVRLPVRGAFHTPAMCSAVPELEATIAELEIRAPSVTAFSSITAEPFDDVPRRLVEALIRPVRWRQTLLALRRAGADRFVEAGPGRVLRGLVRRTLDDVEALTLEETEAVHA
jgi:malonyl CoA-acyl carrier protein transacylase